MKRKLMRPAEFIDLVNHLADTLDPAGLPEAQRRGLPTCDHTLTRTQRWLVQHGREGVQQLEVIECIRDVGARCDCEVILHCDAVGGALAGPNTEDPALVELEKRAARADDLA